MTTNKPEVVAYVDLHRGHGRRYVSLRRGVDHYSLNDGDALIRLSDYEALQAECEKLRLLATECADYLDTNDMTSIGHGSVLHRRLLDAAMQGANHDNQ